MTTKETEKQTIDLQSREGTLFLAAEKYGLSPEHIRQIKARFRELQSMDRKHEVAWFNHLW